MSPTQILGLLLWRTGLLVLTSYFFFRVARYALEYVDLPLQLDWGFGFVLTGAALVLLSFLLERFAETKKEGRLAE